MYARLRIDLFGGDEKSASRRNPNQPRSPSQALRRLEQEEAWEASGIRLANESQTGNI
jgi:hypothetical protein